MSYDYYDLEWDISEIYILAIGFEQVEVCLQDTMQKKNVSLCSTFIFTYHRFVQYVWFSTSKSY